MEAKLKAYLDEQREKLGNPKDLTKVQKQLEATVLGTFCNCQEIAAAMVRKYIRHHGSEHGKV